MTLRGTRSVRFWVILSVVFAAALVYAAMHMFRMRDRARQDTVRVGMQDSPPFYSVGPDGVPRGPVVEVINEAARRAGIPLIWVVDSAGPDHALSSGSADVWPLMGRLSTRLKYFPISDSWLDLSYVMVCPSGCTTRPPATVAHRGTEVTRGIVESIYPNARSLSFPSHAEALQAACDGRADAALISEMPPAGGTLPAPSGCQDSARDLRSLPAGTVSFGLGSRPAHPAARAAALYLRGEIDRMVDDGTLGGIFLRWGVSSGEIRALRAARIATSRARYLTAIALGLLGLLILLSLVYRRLQLAGRECAHINSELRASQSRLEEEYRARRELEERYFHSQRMDSLGRMAGGVAHDFNNLLTVINGYGEMLLEETAGSRLSSLSSQIVNAGRRAAALTTQLLAFSRRQVIEPRPLQINTILEETGTMLRRLLNENIELILRPAPELPLVSADPGQISQILLNLANNSADALPEGGKIILETAPADLDAAYAATHPEISPGPHVLVAVSDTGAGMDAATVSRIFEPFFTTKPAGKGTGLGLATVYGIVRQAGGSIWVYSEPGRGTTFKIYLPVLRGSVRKPVEPAPPPPQSTGHESVLVVEDQDHVRSMMVESLVRAGYSVRDVASGEAALALAALPGISFQLLVTDVVLTGINGRETAERLSALCPGLRVLYTSGYTDNIIVERGVLKPGVRFLSKPFGPQSLCEKVRQVLDEPAA